MPIPPSRTPNRGTRFLYSPCFRENHNSIAIEAAIVRIMKARKTIGHPQLVAEVLSQLSFFRPNPKVVDQ